jgi:hypothetical protein
MREDSTTRKDSALVVLSNIAYRLLLLTYPARFRREYGPHMAQAFRDCCLRALHQTGPPGVLRLWSLTLVDWLKSVIEQPARVTCPKYIYPHIGWASSWAPRPCLRPLQRRCLQAVCTMPATGPTDPFFQTVSMILFWRMLISVGIAGLNARMAKSGRRLPRADPECWVV